MSSSLCYHCIICFESFDCDKHYPVVFPCGHTYVCRECADRIDKCYECRKDLFYYVEDETNNCNINVNNNKQQHQNNNDRYRRSYAYRNNNRRIHEANNNMHHAKQPNKTKVKKRLPLPKNLVLCSLIETDINASKAEKESLRIMHRNNSKHNNNNMSEKEFDLELRAIVDTNTCGTYIVTNKDGTIVHSQKPKSSSSSSSKSLMSTVSDSNLYESIFHHNSSNNNGKLWSVKNKIDKITVTKLNYGDKVQIVAIDENDSNDNNDNNWAILARRKGYVSSKHITRISGPLDEVCRIEGILYNLFMHWKYLETNKKSISKLKKDLIKELKILTSSSSSTKSDVQDITIIPACNSMKEVLCTKKDDYNDVDNNDIHLDEDNDADVNDVLLNNDTSNFTAATSNSSMNSNQCYQERRIDCNNASRQQQSQQHKRQNNNDNFANDNARNNNSYYRTGRSGHSGLSSSPLSNVSAKNAATTATLASNDINNVGYPEVVKPDNNKALLTRRNNTWCHLSMCYS